MNKKAKNICLLELILLIFIIIFKIVVVNNYKSYSMIVNIIFWILFTIGTYFLCGFPRDKAYLKSSSIRIVVIILLIYFLVTYLLGLFLGFTPNTISKNPIETLKQIVPIIIFYTLMELSRYMILKKDVNKAQIIILALEYIILSIIIAISGKDLSTLKRIFIITSTIILPIIANESLCTYITYKVSYVPSLIFKLVIDLYVYFVVFLPTLGNYFVSLIGVTFPFIIFVQIRKNLKYKEKYSIYGKKSLLRGLSAIIIVFTLTMVSLISGIFKYQLIAIVSGSMRPTYDRGDAVFINKKDAKDIKVGEVLAFNLGSGIVTHRIINIDEKDGVFTFTTKGDANETADQFIITNENVIGTVDYVIKYAGFPTVWATEAFERG